ncbi:MAG: hypothetical protein ABII16_03130 [Patescibacteria group bacterium]|nr:hypothetical protein [Patescibacteria group bacterium]
MKKLILFLLILAILVFIYFLVFDKLPKKEINLPTVLEKKEKLVLPSDVPSLDSGIYQCNVDEDCVLVSVSKCCGFVAVNKNFKDEIKSTPMMCLRVCNFTAVCNKGFCQAIETN